MRKLIVFIPFILVTIFMSFKNNDPCETIKESFFKATISYNKNSKIHSISFAFEKNPDTIVSILKNKISSESYLSIDTKKHEWKKVLLKKISIDRLYLEYYLINGIDFGYTIDNKSECKIGKHYSFNISCFDENGNSIIKPKNKDTKKLIKFINEIIIDTKKCH